MPAQKPTLKEKGRMLKIVADLKSRMRELEELKQDIEFKKIRLGVSPKKSRQLLEEIKVPPLEILRETTGKKKTGF
jgi:hypothetical protein